MFDLERMLMQEERTDNILWTDSPNRQLTPAEILEAAGGREKLIVGLYSRALRRKDAKMMAKTRKFVESYVGSPNGSWAGDILKRLDALDSERAASARRRRGQKL